MREQLRSHGTLMTTAKLLARILDTRAFSSVPTGLAWLQATT